MRKFHHGLIADILPGKYFSFNHHLAGCHRHHLLLYCLLFGEPLYNAWMRYKSRRLSRINLLLVYGLHWMGTNQIATNTLCACWCWSLCAQCVLCSLVTIKTFWSAAIIEFHLITRLNWIRRISRGVQKFCTAVSPCAHSYRHTKVFCQWHCNAFAWVNKYLWFDHNITP